MHTFFEIVGIITCFSFGAMFIMIAIQSISDHFRKKHLPHKVKIELDEFEEIICN
jgi:hypothetical protein